LVRISQIDFPAHLKPMNCCREKMTDNHSIFITLQYQHISSLKDAEKNISSALKSVSWMDEIIVVDSGSTDKTLEIAK